MQLDLKLSQKGLLLVSIPLVFQLVFVVVLAGLISSAENDARIAKQGERITARVGNVSKGIIEAELALIGYGCRRYPQLKERYEEIDLKLPKDFEQLKNLGKDVPEIATNITSLELDVIRLRHNMRVSLAAIESGDWMPAVVKLASQSTNSYFSVKKEIEAITNHIKKNYKTHEKEEATKALIWTVLIVMLCTNIVVTIGMALYFSKSIAGRLNVLADNAVRVKDHKELNPLISGNDEIAELDKTFHSMSNALIKAEQRKSEFVSMISHDLRSPLTSLQFTLALAEKGSFGELNEKGKERFARADFTVQRLVKLINELLDIEKLEAGMLHMELQPEDLDGLLKRSIDSVGPLAEKKSIVVETPESGLKVNVEADRIVQVLVNLISNAIKFAPEHSKIVVSAVDLPTGAKVTVADEGRGIPREMVSTIFDRFSQVEREDATTHGGSGLGLAICKAIIEGHGGIIGVDSEEGVGSRFWFIVQKC